MKAAAHNLQGGTAKENFPDLIYVFCELYGFFMIFNELFVSVFAAFWKHI